jgi:SagB-type dehydrogenase family enzyme
MSKEILELYEQSKFDFTKQSAEVSIPSTWIDVFYKAYPRMNRVALADTNYRGGNLVDSLVKRTSEREFDDSQMLYSDLSDIIHYSAGVKNPNDEPNEMRRMQPSAGARFPIELYLIANNVEKLDLGLYHYEVKGNDLEELHNADLRDESDHIFGEGNFAINPNYLVMTSVMSRTEVKYGANAYRFSCIEAGHIAQTMQQITTDKELASCCIGGFDNDKLSGLLDLVDDEIPIYALAFGNPKKD